MCQAHRKSVRFHKSKLKVTCKRTVFNFTCFSSDLDSIRRFIAFWQLINFSINLNFPVAAYCQSLRKLFSRFISHVEVSTLILLLLFSRHCFRFLLRLVEYFLSGLRSSALLSPSLWPPLELRDWHINQICTQIPYWIACALFNRCEWIKIKNSRLFFCYFKSSRVVLSCPVHILMGRTVRLPQAN